MVMIERQSSGRSYAARYIVLCTVVGFALGWIPMFLHGPIPAKFDLLYIRGSIAVLAWYWARLSVGFLIGISVWPARWWVRGPLCGMLALAPPGLVALATPGCGAT